MQAQHAMPFWTSPLINQLSTSELCYSDGIATGVFIFMKCIAPYRWTKYRGQSQLAFQKLFPDIKSYSPGTGI